MNRITRRDFLKHSIYAGGAILATQMIGSQYISASLRKKFTLNVGNDNIK